jgi:hypothetical protein
LYRTVILLIRLSACGMGQVKMISPVPPSLRDAQRNLMIEESSLAARQCLKNLGWWLAAYSNSDQQIYEVPCPECHEHHEIKWKDIQ